MPCVWDTPSEGGRSDMAFESSHTHTQQECRARLFVGVSFCYCPCSRIALYSAQITWLKCSRKFVLFSW